MTNVPNVTMPEHQTVDLDAYFARIGYDGPRTPTLDVLRALHAKQASSIPFENLGPLSGAGVDLAPEAVDEKLLRQGRGGYCFELNGLLLRVLRALGFEVTPLVARVVWQAPPDRPLGPRSHMALLVDLGGDVFFADVGFGGLTLPDPLRFVLGAAQTTSHEEYRIVPVPGAQGSTTPIGGRELALEAHVKTREGASWKPLYRFDLQVQRPVDYEVANHYVATHPRSAFVQNLMVGLPRPGRRYALMNDTFSVYGDDGLLERRALESPDAIRAILRDTFGLRLPAKDGLDQAFARWRATPAR